MTLAIAIEMGAAGAGEPGKSGALGTPSGMKVGARALEWSQAGAAGSESAPKSWRSVLTSLGIDGAADGTGDEVSERTGGGVSGSAAAVPPLARTDTANAGAARAVTGPAGKLLPGAGVATVFVRQRSAGRSENLHPGVEDQAAGGAEPEAGMGSAGRPAVAPPGKAGHAERSPHGPEKEQAGALVDGGAASVLVAAVPLAGAPEVPLEAAGDAAGGDALRGTNPLHSANQGALSASNGLAEDAAGAVTDGAGLRAPSAPAHKPMAAARSAAGEGRDSLAVAGNKRVFSSDGPKNEATEAAGGQDAPDAGQGSAGQGVAGVREAGSAMPGGRVVGKDLVQTPAPDSESTVKEAPGGEAGGVGAAVLSPDAAAAGLPGALTGQGTAAGSAVADGAAVPRPSLATRSVVQGVGRTAHASGAAGAGQHGIHGQVGQVAGQATDASLLAGGVAQMAGKAAGVPATGGAAGGSAGGAAGGSGEATFAALDGEAAAGKAAWIHAGAQRAEAGFEDPALGWVGVRADMAGGAVHASVVPGSAEAAQALGGHLTGLSAFLNEQRTPVETLTMSAPEGRGAGAGSEAGTGQGAGHGNGQQAGRDDGSGRAGDAARSVQTGGTETVGNRTVRSIAGAMDAAPQRRGASISVMA